MGARIMGRGGWARGGGNFGRVGGMVSVLASIDHRRDALHVASRVALFFVERNYAARLEKQLGLVLCDAGLVDHGQGAGRICVSDRSADSFRISSKRP